MKFKYSVIGDNTQENREHLEKLGYKPNMISDNDNMLYTREYVNGWMYSGCPYMNIPDSYINCLNNPHLFQAVTAMREDSDYMQLFYIDVLCGIGGQMVGSEPKKRFWSICKDEKQKDQKKLKATLSELIAHFKVEH